MRSSKKYQEIADSLNIVKNAMGILPLQPGMNRQDNPEQFLFDHIVTQFMHDCHASFTGAWH